jgi:hypothetical protein
LSFVAKNVEKKNIGIKKLEQAYINIIKGKERKKTKRRNEDSNLIQKLAHCFKSFGCRRSKNYEERKVSFIISSGVLYWTNFREQET